ncbi:MAG: glycerate kinase type-2 family protein [Candidatus Saccharibacteria bacterium]
MSNWFKNYDEIATTPERRDALAIAEAALDAIDTETVIRNSVSIQGDTLKVKDQAFDLKPFKNIKVIGFGKASCKAASALEKIIGDRIQTGIAIGLEAVACENIRTYQGTHPEPSAQNVEVSGSILEMSRNATADDLVIVIVSGGGSALLCWPKEECDQGQILYHRFLKSGGDIRELNVVRKHISQLKGGGLAKALYPATVIGLIFSDVPGDDLESIASGPTFRDTSTMADALKIIEKYGLGSFNLNETPKDEIYFEKVHNIPVVTNLTALEAMRHKAGELGYQAGILTSELYDQTEQALQKTFAAAKPGACVLAGGEVSLVVTTEGGSGGRNLNLAMNALKLIGPADTLLTLASDGLDNGPKAGAIVDRATVSKLKESGLDLEDHIKRYDAENLFVKLGTALVTGPTEANVSDLLLLIRK